MNVEKELINKVYKNKYPMSKFARDKFISRTHAYKMREKIIKKLANLMEKGMAT